MNKKSNVYQPLLLRIIHNLQGISVILAMITAFWTYNTYDGRWVKVNWLPDWNEVEGIHGTFGLWALLIFPVFIVYVFHRGYVKLVQPDTWQKLKLINKPIWWYSLHRIVNTLSLFALAFAVFSGKMMDENWLPDGELNHFWYYLHLISLVLMLLSVLTHLLMSVKIGASPLILSMLSLTTKSKDSWQILQQEIITNSTNFKSFISIEWQNISYQGKFLEVILILIIISSWLISFAK